MSFSRISPANMWMVLLISCLGVFTVCHGQTLEQNVTDLLWHKFQDATNTHQGNISLTSKSFLERFICSDEEHMCPKCPSSSSNTAEEFSIYNFIEKSLGWMYDVLCEHADAGGDDETYFTNKWSAANKMDVDPKKVDATLSLVKKMYKPVDYSKCFSWQELSHDLLPEVTHANQAIKLGFVKYLMTDVFIRLYQGECILPTSSEDFLYELFTNYGSAGSDVMTESGLNQLMSEIGIKRASHSHEDSESDHSHSADHAHGYIHGDHDHDHAGHDHSLHNDHIQYHDAHDHNHAHDHSHDPDNDSEYIAVSLLRPHSRPSPQLEELRSLPTSAPRRVKRHDGEDHEGHNHDTTKEPPIETKTISKKCWNAEDLMHMFDENSSGNLSSKEFSNLVPALIHQRLQTECIPENNNPKERNTLQVYGYGTLAVLVISLCSVLGVVLMPIQNSSLYQYIMMCFIALAFGTLTGDALLHLIPESMGIHLHDEGNGLPPMFWKFIALLGAVYGLFVFEGLADLAVHGIRKKEHGEGGHGHSHIPEIDLVRMVTKGENKTMSQETLASKESIPATLNGDLNTTPHEPAKMIEGQTTVCFGMTTLALVIIVGDAIHNVADGLTIGAAFASSMKGGMSSALAILFHELPHEFGDFVILLSTGFTYKKALIWNFISSLTAFIGLYVGIELGESAEARQWILIIAAGMFLYIAVGDMLPELKNQKGDNGLVAFIVQNIGALVGMIFMILMGVFESKIKIS